LSAGSKFSETSEVAGIFIGNNPNHKRKSQKGGDYQFPVPPGYEVISWIAHLAFSVYSNPTNLSGWGMVIPIRLAEKRIYRDCRTGALFDSDDRTLSSRPTENISASLGSHQARSQSVPWFDGTLPRNKIRQRSLFEVAAHMRFQS